MAEVFETCRPPQLMTPAWLNQAAPVQNQWYNVLPTTLNVVVYNIILDVTVANETLELEIVYDGVTQVISQAAIVGTFYQIAHSILSSNGLMFGVGAAALTPNVLFFARSVQVRIRKTTALGAVTLRCKVEYGRW